jgi:hypothetical protein
MMKSHTREADAEEKVRIKGLTDGLGIYIKSRDVTVDDAINACLDYATHLLLLNAGDPVQTREAWLQHCAAIYDETLAMLAQQGAKA